MYYYQGFEGDDGDEDDETNHSMFSSSFSFSINLNKYYLLLTHTTTLG